MLRSTKSVFYNTEEEAPQNADADADECPFSEEIFKMLIGK